MPSRNTHAVAGGLASLPLTVLMSTLIGRHLTLGEFAATIVSAVMGSIMPDVVEPARSPNHRGLLHSLLALAGLAALAYKMIGELSGTEQALSEDLSSRHSIGLPIQPEEQARLALIRLLLIAATALVAGYLLHLVMDSTTPKGLPLLG